MITHSEREINPKQEGHCDPKDVVRISRDGRSARTSRDAVPLVTSRFGESSRVVPLKNGLCYRHIIPSSYNNFNNNKSDKAADQETELSRDHTGGKL